MAKQTIITNDAELIAKFVKTYHQRNNVYTMTAVVEGDGNQIVIADQNQRGYTRIGIIAEYPKYDDAQKLAQQVNLILFPDRSLKENLMIQLSSMR